MSGKITPEIIWTNKEAIFLFAIVIAFALFLFSFKSKDKVHIGSAQITKTHLEGVQRTRMYTVEVRKDKSASQPLFTTILTGKEPNMEVIREKRPRTPFAVKYRKAPDGSWMLIDIQK